MVFAHRGAHSRERENTLGAFRDALDIGVEGVELDVRRCVDGALVVHHDPEINGVAISASRAKDLPAYVPHLDAALDVLEGVRVNVEVKNVQDPKEPTYDESGEFVESVIDLLRRSSQRSLLELSCFDLATCVKARAYDESLPISFLTWKVPLLDALEVAAREGLRGVNPHFLLVNAEAQQRALDLGLDLNVWTVNDAADLTAMAELGVRSVMTDQPALAVLLLHRGAGPT
jgi:glycerophosphoryl diester phosphodiesterase